MNREISVDIDHIWFTVKGICDAQLTRLHTVIKEMPKFRISVIWFQQFEWENSHLQTGDLIHIYVASAPSEIWADDMSFILAYAQAVGLDTCFLSVAA